LKPLKRRKEKEEILRGEIKKMAVTTRSSQHHCFVRNITWLRLTIMSIFILSCDAKKLRLEHMPKHHPPESHHQEPDHSFVLTFGNISALDEAIQNHSFLAVMFYAPWCGHSRRIAPHWTEASVVLRRTSPGVILGKVDLSKPANAELRIRYGIRGFPSLKVFKAHSELPYEFRGAQDTDGIVNYLTIERGRCKDCTTTEAEKVMLETQELVDEHGF
jgi:thiol-disulfide isomerase/thioredoxin